MIRKIVFICAVICMLSCSLLYASTAVHVRSTTDDSVLFLTGSTSGIYTDTVNMNRAYVDDEVGIMYKATALYTAGVVDLDVYVEGSHKPPTTKGAADSSYLMIKAVDLSVTDEDWHLATLDSVITPYIRFRVDGQGSNDIGTQFEIKVITSGM